MLQSGLVAAGVLALAWALALVVNRRGVRRHDRSGHVKDDIIIFVEPVRWLFVIWGFAQFVRGLRRSGCGADVRLFRWSSPAGALLVVPDVVRQNWLNGHADRLAREMDRIAVEQPGATIHLAGYSTGCYISIEAARRVCAHTQIQQVVLLAGTVSPRYPLEVLHGRVRKVLNVHSRLDLINWIGPALFGTNDRRWGAACGTIGFDTTLPFVTQRAWRANDLHLGYCGDHFTVASPRFVAEHIGPFLKST